MAHITSDGQVYLQENEMLSYKEPDIYAFPYYDSVSEVVRVTVSPSSPLSGFSPIGGTTYVFTKSEVNAFTGTGAGDAEKFENAVLQAVKDILDGITENSGVTFTIV
jgi:hypothetical protein